MAIERDIARLDSRIDKSGERCDAIHTDLNECLVEIRTMLARLDERIGTAGDSLLHGDEAFEKIDKRLDKLESWKSSLIGWGAALSFMGAVAGSILTLGFDWIITRVRGGV